MAVTIGRLNDNCCGTIESKTCQRPATGIERQAVASGHNGPINPRSPPQDGINLV
jgi:hypothetical protein